jgi:hypothetical protein
MCSPLPSIVQDSGWGSQARQTSTRWMHFHGPFSNLARTVRGRCPVVRVNGMAHSKPAMVQVQGVTKKNIGPRPKAGQHGSLTNIKALRRCSNREQPHLRKRQGFRSAWPWVATGFTVTGGANQDTLRLLTLPLTRTILTSVEHFLHCNRMDICCKQSVNWAIQIRD